VYQILQRDIYIVGNWHTEARKEFEEDNSNYLLIQLFPPIDRSIRKEIIIV